MRSAIVAMIVVMTAAACAPAPETIGPAYVSDLPFRTYSCEQLGEEQARLSQALATASTQQSKARANDVMGVIILKLPIGSLSGQAVTPLISLYKGQIEAVHRASMNNGCPEAARVQPAPPVVSPAVQQPAIQQPAIQQPAVQQPATQQPAWLPTRGE